MNDADAYDRMRDSWLDLPDDWIDAADERASEEQHEPKEAT